MGRDQTNAATACGFSPAANVVKKIQAPLREPVKAVAHGTAVRQARLSPHFASCIWHTPPGGPALHKFMVSGGMGSVTRAEDKIDAMPVQYFRNEA